MRVTSINVAPSPLADDRVRLSAQVVLASGDRDDLHIEYPARYAPDICTSGTPWLVAMLPAAYWLGEDLTIDAPVDPELRWRVAEVQGIWRAWHGRPEVQVHADLQSEPAVTGAPRVAAFLTGGIDSLFTVLHCDLSATQQNRVAEALCVAGMDIAVADEPQHQIRFGRLDQFCRQRAKQLVPVRTNIREGCHRLVDYSLISHGPLLAATALGIGRRYSHVLISSSCDSSAEGLFPWGSHPLTDSLFSSSSTRMIHYGIGFTRTQKTELVARYPDALAALHVCYAEQSADNCGRCSKCLRTLATLDVCGALREAVTFPRDTYTLKALSRIPIHGAPVAFITRDVAVYALAHGRPDVARAIRMALARQWVLDHIPRFIRNLPRSIRNRLAPATG